MNTCGALPGTEEVDLGRRGSLSWFLESRKELACGDKRGKLSTHTVGWTAGAAAGRCLQSEGKGLERWGLNLWGLECQARTIGLGSQSTGGFHKVLLYG